MVNQAASSKLGALLVAFAMVVAATLPASAKSLEFNDDSLPSTLAGIAAAMKHETEAFADAVAEASEQARPMLEGWKARAEKSLDGWREALSGQKDSVTTFSRDLDAALGEWRQVASRTWLKLHTATRDALDRFNAWLRGRSAPGRNDPFPV
jgi:hypothetical protein